MQKLPPRKHCCIVYGKQIHARTSVERSFVLIYAKAYIISLLDNIALFRQIPRLMHVFALSVALYGASAFFFHATVLQFSLSKQMTPLLEATDDYVWYQRALVYSKL
jgi:hypothetical protein